MPAAILCLLGCQLVGELLREATHLPVPGPVIGMFLLAAILAHRGGRGGGPIPPALERAAETLICLMGLLFVPAGVGIIAQASLLREEWLPILAALLGSTVLGIAVTGVVMHRAMLRSWATRTSTGLPDDLRGLRHE
jgi:holin-like protein